MPKILSNLMGWLTGIMMCLIVLVSVRNFSKIPLGVGPVHYTAGFTLMAFSAIYFILDKKLHSFVYLFPLLYVIWTSICIYRGQFEVTSPFIFNQYLHGILFVSSPIVIFLFAGPNITLKCFQILNLFTVIFGFASYQWNMRISAYPFCFPVFFYIYLCFWPKIPKLWRYITLACVGMVFLAHENGSARIKIIMAIGTLFVFILPNWLRKMGLNIGHWLFYIVACVFLYLGLSGQYNIFKGQSPTTGPKVYEVGVESTQQLNATGHIDTRSFIYEEMIESAFMFDHVFTGRTPARGYHSPSFAKDATPTEGIDIAERHGSEVALLNTFQWLGLIGLLLITGVYLQGTCLAMYSSNNIYVKCLAMTCSFHWAYSWVENMNQFMMIDLMIYICLAFCYSPHFRSMSDFEFECFFKSLFAKLGSISTYDKYSFVKSLLAVKASRAPKSNTTMVNVYKKVQ